MSNAYYQNTGFPTYGSQASSSVMRAELVKIQAAFDKLPAPTGFAYALVQVKGDESGLTATGILVDAAGKMILPAGIAVSSGGAVIVGPAEVSGDTTLANVTINGTLNMNAGTVGTITGLSEPVIDSDAATKGYVVAAINALVDSAPGTLDTLNEIAAALGDDPNLAATLNAEIATKLPKAGGTMSGQIDMAGNKITGLAAPASGTDAVRLQYVTDLYGSTASAAASAQVATTQAGIATTQAGIATTKAQEAADSAAQAAAAAPVQSVAGKTGHVALTKADVGLANVENTSDANKPVSTAQQAAIDASRVTLIDSYTSTSLTEAPTANALKAGVDAAVAVANSRAPAVHTHNYVPVDSNRGVGCFAYLKVSYFGGVAAGESLAGMYLGHPDGSTAAGTWRPQCFVGNQASAIFQRIA